MSKKAKIIIISLTVIVLVIITAVIIASHAGSGSGAGAKPAHSIAPIQDDSSTSPTQTDTYPANTAYGDLEDDVLPEDTDTGNNSNENSESSENSKNSESSKSSAISNSSDNSDVTDDNSDTGTREEHPAEDNSLSDYEVTGGDNEISFEDLFE